MYKILSIKKKNDKAIQSYSLKSSGRADSIRSFYSYILQLDGAKLLCNIVPTCHVLARLMYSIQYQKVCQIRNYCCKTTFVIDKF